MPSCVITRRGTDVGKNTDRRVFVTGPHFGTSAKGGIFSSTEEIEEASRYERHEAEALLGFGKWRNHDPLIVEVSNA